MNRRHGFTLVELLVSMALTLFIMVILTQAFATGLEVFGQFKAIGDMQDNLRAAANALRADLAADHFEGKKRLSDPALYTADGRPTSGFVRIITSVPTAEGTDPDGIASSRSIGDRLHLSVKRRGNHRNEFFSATVPTTSPLITSTKTTFFGQPSDHRVQEGNTLYSSQWSEVAYLLLPTGTTIERNNIASPLGTKLFALYRIERVVVPDTTYLNSQADLTLPPDGVFDTPIFAGQDDAFGVTGPRTQYGQMSCQLVGTVPNQTLRFNNPSDLTIPAQRSINFDGGTAGLRYGATLLMTNVISFQIRVLRHVPAAPSGGANYDREPQLINFDSSTSNTATPTEAPLPPIPEFLTGDTRQSFIRALVITLRVWDLRTQQSRQVTIVQDM